MEGLTDMMEVEEAGGAKRTHPEGTPDREASTRARPHAREAPPTTLSNRPINAEIETHKVEMSAATMATFRMMMREEIAVIEEAITNKVHNSIQDIKEELKQEKEARMKLEERITKLEEGKGAQNSNPTLEDADVVEKEKVVIGGQSISQACTPRGEPFQGAGAKFHFIHTLHAHWLQKSKKPFNCCFHTTKSCAVSSQRPNLW